MKPIYKSLALASMELQISLALNAETRDDESASTIALQAELLDSLRVELVAQNVSGARNLIESGECVINGSNLMITLDTGEWTRGAMYRVQVLATFGTQTQVIYALNVTVPYYIALSNVPQEFEDNVTIVSTITDVTEADLEGLALEETSQEIKAAITPISAAAEAYNTGKVELAENISAKGIPAAATETLPELAEKVLDIQQTTTVIDGGNMYAAQLFGDGALWNLYDVLADMKSRFMGAGQYACLIVCEYYKDYDSLQLQGADAYYTCDGDFYDVSSPLHTWHDSDNGKANRWVCFLFASEGARLDITNTAISPCSMYIGGHIGTIEYFVNGRLTELVSGVEETDVLDYFLTAGYAQNWGRNCIIKGIKNVMTSNKSGFVVLSDGLVYINNVASINIPAPVNNDVIKAEKASYVELNANMVSINVGVYNLISVKTATNVVVKGISQVSGSSNYAIVYMYNAGASPIQILDLRDITSTSGWILFFIDSTAPYLIDIIVGEMVSNIKCNFWNPTNVLADADKKAQLIENIKNHILARVSDATGGTQLVFTVSTNMYNAIASEQIEWQGETMSLADAFLTKNWLLAGA